MAFTSRERLLALCECLLRVPPIYLLNEIFKSGFHLPSVSVVKLVLGSYLNETTGQADFYYTAVLSLAHFLLALAFSLATAVIAILKLHQLITVYLYAFSLLGIYASFRQNENLVEYFTRQNHDADIFSIPTRLFLPNFFICAFLSFFYSYLYPNLNWLPSLFLLNVVTPILACLTPSPAAACVLEKMPIFSSIIPVAIALFVLWANLPVMIHTLINGWRASRSFILSFGLPSFLELQWTRLNILHVLKVFWVARILLHVWQYSAGRVLFPDGTLQGCLPVLYDLMKTSLVGGCESFIAVLGMTSWVSYFCQIFGGVFRRILQTEEDDKNFGIVSGMLFCILALQTGISSLESEKRFVRLCRNFYLLFVAFLHITHSMLNPLLMSLSASRNPAYHRHVRALSVTAFLIIVPIWLLSYLWKNHAISTWLLAVSAFSLELVVKVLVSVIIYTLFLIDSMRESFWEQLDDYVYYIRSFGNTVEFFFGILLFFNGAWILLFESGGAVRATMMCIHAYFNIWCDAKTGWSVFMKRRTAVRKIDTLPDADEGNLEKLQDVCCICYQQMRTAKITACNHYFHAVCLRKWLYLQDYCPICHNILYRQEGPNKKTVFLMREPQVEDLNG